MLWSSTRSRRANPGESEDSPDGLPRYGQPLGRDELLREVLVVEPGVLPAREVHDTLANGIRSLVRWCSSGIPVQHALAALRANLLPQALELTPRNTQRLGTLAHGKLASFDAGDNVESSPLPLAHPHPSSIGGVTESFAC
jgi:hypothetical protein